MKLISTVASLGLVAARPQGINTFPGQHNALDDLASGLDGGLDASALGDLSVPDITVNQSQLDDIADDVVDTVASKKPMPPLVPSDQKHAEAVNNKIKEVYEKYEAAWDKKQQFDLDTQEKIQKAQDKAQDKVDRVVDKNAAFAAAHDIKKQQAKAKKDQFNADTDSKKQAAQEHKKKLEAKQDEKKQNNDDKKQKAQEQKEAVDNKTEQKKLNAVLAQQKKDQTAQLKLEKKWANKKLHYHKIVAECWKKLKQENPDVGSVEDTTFDENTFAGLPKCEENLQDFMMWDEIKDWLNKEKPMNKPMGGNKPMGNKPMGPKDPKPEESS